MSAPDAGALDACDLAALQMPGAFPHDTSAAGGVELVETHISWVFLTRDRVYKFRKPVDLGFVDFSTQGRRTADCERELMLNRRLAADVYLGIAALTRENGRVAVGPALQNASDGAEHCVVMRRLAAERDALSMLERGRLSRAHLDRVAAEIARFHAAHRLGRPAPWSADQWLARIRAPAADNFSTLRDAKDVGIAEEPVETAAAAERAFLARSRVEFERRRVDGRAVDGHGDLHLAHVWFEHDEAGPLVIDCLEFDDDLRRIDAAADVAFLAMDLVYRGAGSLAESFLARYAEHADDHHLYAVVDYYIAYRAAVRAKVAALAARDAQLSGERRERAAESARKHLALAAGALAPRPAGTLVITSGVVGTGKSTVATLMAEQLGAPRISSDDIRKVLHASLTREQRYRPESRAEIYREVLGRAGAVLQAGRNAVVDATFESRELRTSAARCAAAAGAAVWLVETIADPAVIRARLAARTASASVKEASEAGPDQYAGSAARFEPVDDWPSDRHVRVHTDADDWKETVARIVKAVAQR